MTTHHRREAIFRSTVAFDHPATDVADLVLDWGNDPLWRSHVTGFTTTPRGPARVGQRLVEELRFAGSTHLVPTEVTAAEFLQASYAGGNDRVTVRGTRTVVPRTPAGCEVHIVTHLQLTGALRLVAPVLVPVLRRAQDTDLRRASRFVLPAGRRVGLGPGPSEVSA